MNNECSNNCHRYRQSIEDIVDAGNKHKEKALALKEIAVDQKNKISILREEKYHLQHRVDQLEYENKDQTELIMKMTKETRDLKKDVCNLRKDVIEKDEIIQEQTVEKDKAQHFKENMTDLKDEILLKDIKISNLEEVLLKRDRETEKTLESELKIDSKEEQLEAKIELLKKELNSKKEREISDKYKREELLKRMDDISQTSKHDLDRLKVKLKDFKQKSLPKCWFGIKCIRLFCKFDHSFVFQKDNRILKLPVQNPQVEEVEENQAMCLCEKCGELFRNSCQCKKHLHSTHGQISPNEVKMFRCRECPLTFQTRSCLNSHSVEEHNEDEIECEQCGKFFVSRKELTEHRKSHKSFDTSIVSLTNMLQGLLDKDECSNISNKEKHQDEIAAITFQCDDCSKTFLTKTSLKKHRKKIHKVYVVKNMPKENNPFKNNPNRKLECGMCVRNFVSLEEMDEHMDDTHGGRWKLGDPDVVFEGDSYEESLDSEYSSTESETEESSESQSGGD